MRTREARIMYDTSQYRIVIVHVHTHTHNTICTRNKPAVSYRRERERLRERERERAVLVIRHGVPGAQEFRSGTIRDRTKGTKRGHISALVSSTWSRRRYVHNIYKVHVGRIIYGLWDDGRAMMGRVKCASADDDEETGPHSHIRFTEQEYCTQWKWFFFHGKKIYIPLEFVF